jgi:hypothetical protein
MFEHFIIPSYFSSKIFREKDFAIVGCWRFYIIEWLVDPLGNCPFIEAMEEGIVCVEEVFSHPNWAGTFVDCLNIFVLVVYKLLTLLLIVCCDSAQVQSICILGTHPIVGVVGEEAMKVFEGGFRTVGLP